MMPSSAPTHMTAVQGSFTVSIPLENLLNNTQILAFELGTAAFIDGMVTGSGRLSDPTVDVTAQEVVEIEETQSGSNGGQSQRELMNWSDLNIVQHLVVQLNSAAVYSGSDMNFNFTSFLEQQFLQENQHWLMLLENSDEVFNGIVPIGVEEGNPQESESKSITGGDSSGLSPGGVAAAAILAVCAVVLGIVAAMYSLRHYNESVYGKELASLPGSNSSTGSNIAKENFAEFQRHQDSLLAKQIDDDAVSWRMGSDPPMSPGALEQGELIPIDQIMKPQSNLHISASRDSQGSRGNIASTGSRHNEGSQQSRKDPVGNKADARMMESLFDNNASFHNCR